MIKIDKDRKVFITSDTHYGHKNLCRGVTDWRLPDGGIPISQTRDFDTIEKMNEKIIKTINSIVGEDDVLIRDRILCKEIRLILGNHDTHIENDRYNVQELFTSVSHYTKLMYKNNTFVLSHYPIQSWDGLNKGHIQLHGHCHLPTNLRFGKGKKMDVGMDGHPTFGIYDMDDIIRIMDKREIMSDMLFDHHTDEIKGIVG
jgi:calcineurin-like phosphoesterase family protein